jgi:DNA polymerase-3 subunit beta
MHIRIQQKELQESLARVQNIVERRTAVPVLTQVLFETTDEGHLRVTATDLEHTLVQILPATIQKPGSCTLPAHTLYDLVRRFSADQIFEVLTGEDSADQVLVRCGRSRFTLPCYPVGHYPPVPELQVADQFRLSAAHVRQMIDLARFAMATEETRYALNGLYWHVVAGEGAEPFLASVATDVHRLSRVLVPLPAGAENLGGMILSRKTVNEIRKMVDALAETEEVEFALSGGQMRLVVGQQVFLARLVDGVFPDYMHVLERKPVESFLVPAAAFRQAVDRVSVVAADKTRLVRFRLEPGFLTLSAESAEYGSAVEPLDVEWQGAHRDIGFNARYVADINQQITSERVRLFLNDASGPTFFENEGAANVLFLVMPLRG